MAGRRSTGPRNALYAQSGGVTAVINATACGVIEACRRHKRHIGNLYAGRDGIVGVLTEDLIDTGRENAATIRALRHTPSGAFGSARYKLKDLERDRAKYERLIEVFRAHDIGYFFYNGGNDSMDTALKLSQLGAQTGYPIACIGIPKTVDNDLPVTDCCPGFGSVAKYVAVSTLEASLDVASMARTSTRVFVLEVMGRHAGWIAAAGGLAARKAGDPPHIILFPEIAFDRERFLARVKETVEKKGYCVIVASEGTRDAEGKFLSDMGTRDAFGHVQLGGVAPTLAQMVKQAHRLQVSLGARRLPAALRAPRRLEGGRRAGLCRRPRGGRARARRQERGDAGHPPQVLEAVSLGHLVSRDRGGREQGKNGAAQLHHRGRLRDHGGRPSLSRTADRRRGQSAVQERDSRVCDAEERARSPPAVDDLRDMIFVSGE